MLHESTNQDRRLNQAILTASEHCQQDIAQLVHNTLCQTLGGVSLMVKVFAGELRSGISLRADQLDDLGKVLDRALEEARQIFTQLQPVSPAQDGLIIALARLALDTSSNTPCFFVCEDAVLINDPDLSIAFYRIAEEAVKKAVNHAQARRITISLADLDGAIVLTICDDGVADVQQAESRIIYGTDLMQSRAQTAGGTLTSKSASGGGTTVTFSLPKSEVKSVHGQDASCRG